MLNVLRGNPHILPIRQDHSLAKSSWQQRSAIRQLPLVVEIHLGPSTGQDPETTAVGHESCQSVGSWFTQPTDIGEDHNLVVVQADEVRQVGRRDHIAADQRGDFCSGNGRLSRFTFIVLIGLFRIGGRRECKFKKGGGRESTQLTVTAIHNQHRQGLNHLHNMVGLVIDLQVVADDQSRRNCIRARLLKAVLEFHLARFTGLNRTHRDRRRQAPDNAVLDTFRFDLL